MHAKVAKEIYTGLAASGKSKIFFALVARSLRLCVKGIYRTIPAVRR